MLDRFATAVHRIWDVNFQFNKYLGDRIMVILEKTKVSQCICMEFACDAPDCCGAIEKYSINLRHSNKHREE